MTFPSHIQFCLLAVVVFLRALPALAEPGFDDGLKSYYRLDYQAALETWHPLAEAGHRASQYQLGVLYYRGEGVTQDYRTAAAWFRRAAEAGDPDAQFSLASMYSEGRGVPRNLTRAHMWFQIAAWAYGSRARETWAMERHGLALRNRDWIATRLPTEEILRADRLARQWKPTRRQ